MRIHDFSSGNVSGHLLCGTGFHKDLWELGCWLGCSSQREKEQVQHGEKPRRITCMLKLYSDLKAGSRESWGKDE